MKMKLRKKRLFSVILSTALILTQFPPALASQSSLSSTTVLSGTYDSVTVTTPKQFMAALEQKAKHIIVNDLITIGDEAEASGRMLPVVIPEGTTIEGTVKGTLSCRCPIQIGGEGVTFKNIKLVFESSDALGSIPHREIFLAGYDLTLDNVRTYLEGGGGIFGPLGGYEKELLPSIFAGGYKGTSIGSNAVLTIKNSNSDTIIQDIYMGHEEGPYQHVPYKGDVILNLDNSVTVRGGVYTDQNSSAEITLSGNEKSLFNNVQTMNFIGSDTTTLTITGCSASGMSLNGIGTIILKDNAYLMPHTNLFHNIRVQEKSCLDFSEVIHSTITGNFEGGEVVPSNPDADTAGILVLDKEGTLMIEGTVSGTTIFQTESKNFPGIPTVGKDYIIAKWDQTNGENFIIPEKYIEDGYKIQYNTNAWSIFKSYEDEENPIPAIGTVEISSAPAAIDLAKIKIDDADDSIPDKSIFCKIIWKDTEENPISFFDIIDDETGYFFHSWNILCVKTEYLENPDYNMKEDWGNTLQLRASKEEPDNFYFIANDEAKTGNYTIRFYSIDTYDIGITIEDLKEKDKYIVNELQIYLYDSSQIDTSTSSIEQAQIQTISEQIYTGNPICPEIKVVDSNGTELKLEEDYLVSYENNRDVGKAKVKVVGIGNYHGELTAEFSIIKSETDVLVTAMMNSDGTSTESIHATYGDKIRFICQAEPAHTRMARAAKPDTVDFYSGDILLGTAQVDSKGQAVYVYNTIEQKIPVGASTVYADFGGTTALNPAQSDANVSITLEKQTLAAEDIKSVTLKDFSYDGVKKITDIISFTWSKTQELSEKESKTFFVSGEAELANTQAGTYNTAKILSWSLNEEDAKWYQLPEISGSLLVEPEVTIIPAKAPEQVAIFSSSASGQEQTISIKEKIPAELLSEKTTYQLGKQQFNSSISATPSIADGILTYQAGVIGTETIPVIITLENYEPMTVMINVSVTDKRNVKIDLDSPDIAYNGEPYNEWKASVSKDDLTITYYDFIEQQTLKEAPTDTGSYSITVHMENDTEIGEETSYFQIKPKEIRLRPLDRIIQIGEEVPDLSNPKLDIDYEFESGYEPVNGENLGTIRMLYGETPDNKKEGSYQIFIGLFEKNHKNYSITEEQGTLYIRAEGEHIHNYEETITKEPTCIETGIKTYICSECNDSYTEEIPKKEHSYGEWIIDKEPTSTTEGTKHRVCGVCGEIETATIPKKEDNKPEETDPGEETKPEETDPGEETKPEETDPGEETKPEETDPGEETKPEETDPGEETKPEETDPGEETKPEETDPGEETKPEETDPGEETKPEETDPGEETKPEETDPGEETKPEETDPGEETKPEETDPGEETKPEETDPGEETKPEETDPGEETKPEETDPGEDNNKPDDDESDDSNSDDEEEDYRPGNSHRNPSTESSTIKTENVPSTTEKIDYKDSIRGYISFTKGIITKNETGYAKWKQSDNKWWLEYADGTWPHGQYTSNGQQIYKWERINGAWYAFNADGYIQHGWNLDAGYQGWFYIDSNSGMKTGWQLIEGKWYYLNPISDGTRGKMFANCYTPDGWYVDESGAWDGKAQQKR